MQLPATKSKKRSFLICREHFTDNIEKKYFCSALKQQLSNKMIYSKEIIVLGRRAFLEIISSFLRKLYGISVNLKRISFKPKSKCQVRRIVSLFLNHKFF